MMSKVLAIFASGLILAAGLCAAPVQGEEYTFDAFRNGSKVGDGYFAVAPKGDRTEVDYRLNIVVRVAFIPAFTLERHQYAVFDPSGRLLYAKSSTTTNGEKHEVEACSEGENAIRVRRGDQEDRIDKEQFVMTTLNPIYQTPTAGRWLDLTKGNLVPYEVAKDGDNQFVLKHGSETDHIVKDPSGFLSDLTVSSDEGVIELKRAASDAAPDQIVRHFSVEEAEEKSEGCLA